MSVQQVRAVYTKAIEDGSLSAKEASDMDAAIGDVLDKDENVYVSAMIDQLKAGTLKSDSTATTLMLQLPDSKHSRFGAIASRAAGYTAAGVAGGTAVGAGVGVFAAGVGAIPGAGLGFLVGGAGGFVAGLSHGIFGD